MRIALTKEERITKQFGRPIRVLVPLMIDDYALNYWCGDGMDAELKSPVVSDFRHYEDDDAFNESLEPLIKSVWTDVVDEDIRPPPSQ